MNGQPGSVPWRLHFARRWQWPAAAACVLFVLACFVGWPLGHFWPSAVTFFGFVPGIWVFNTQCYRCGYPAFAGHEADEKLARDERFWTQFWGKDYGGRHLPLRCECSKCGAPFTECGKSDTH